MATNTLHNALCITLNLFRYLNIKVKQVIQATNWTSLRRPSSSDHNTTLAARCCALAPPEDIDRQPAAPPTVTSYRSISAACARAAANRLLSCCWSTGQTDRRTHGGTPDRYKDAYCMLCGQNQQYKYRRRRTWSWLTNDRNHHGEIIMMAVVLVRRLTLTASMLLATCLPASVQLRTKVRRLMLSVFVLT